MATGNKSDAKATARPTQQFFEALAERGHEPLLERISGTIRFDLDTWPDLPTFLEVEGPDAGLEFDAPYVGDVEGRIASRQQ